MTPNMYSNAIKLLLLQATQQAQQSTFDRKTIAVMIFGAIITAILGFGGWLIKRQIEHNDDNNSEHFDNIQNGVTDMKTEIADVKDGLHQVSLEIAKEYIPLPRFEKHEAKNDAAIERLHKRIDGIQGAPKRIENSNN